ncbi:MAG: hypothetical protein KGZ79_16690 [Dethiobacter sp.]|jgi:hypothetical protein|nr:hypothetical protein [Dethiobacter sp.]
MILTEQTWQWLIDKDVEMLGLWVFIHTDNCVIREIADKLDAIEDIEILIDIAITLTQKAAIMKKSTLFTYGTVCVLERTAKAALEKRIKTKYSDPFTL